MLTLNHLVGFAVAAPAGGGQAPRHYRIGTAAGGETIKQYVTNQNLTCYELGLFASTDGGGTNLALGKTLTASSTRSGYPLSNAADGNASTRWDSQDPPTGAHEWLQVDLGAGNAAVVRSISWDWYDAGTNAWIFRVGSVWASLDGTTWSEIATLSGHDQGASTPGSYTWTIPSALL